MSRRKAKKMWYVTETPINGKRQRRCRGTYDDKTRAVSFQKHMKELFGDRYKYRLRWEWV